MNAGLPYSTIFSVIGLIKNAASIVDLLFLNFCCSSNIQTYWEMNELKICVNGFITELSKVYTAVILCLLIAPPKYWDDDTSFDLYVWIISS